MLIERLRPVPDEAFSEDENRVKLRMESSKQMRKFLLMLFLFLPPIVVTILSIRERVIPLPPNLGYLLLAFSASIATWFALVFAFFQAFPDARKFFYPSPRERIFTDADDFPFEIYSPRELSDSWPRLVYREIPYVKRLPDTDYETLLHEMKAAHRLILTGRTGLGKTREALELFVNLESENIEEISVIVPKGALETPLRIPTHKLGKNVILFIDDLPTQQLAIDDLNDPRLVENFRERLFETILRFEAIFGSRFRVVATAQTQSSAGLPVDFANPFWSQFKLLPLPDFEEKYRFLQHVEKSLNVNLTVDAKLFLSERSDGTPAGLVFPVIKERGKARIQKFDIEKYNCTYPSDWENQIYYPLIASDDYRKAVLNALSLLNQIGIYARRRFVVELASRIYSPRFSFWYRARINRSLEELGDWVQIREGEFVNCADAYLRKRSDFQMDPEVVVKTAFSLVKRSEEKTSLIPILGRLVDYFLFTASNPSVALQVALKMVIADPQNAIAWSRLSSVYFTLGDFDQAQRANQRAMGLTDHPATMRRQATISAATGRTTQAIKEFKEVLAHDTNDDLSNIYLAIIFNRANRHAEALHHAQEAVRINAFRALNQITLAISLDKLELPEALDTCITAASLDPTFAPAWWTLAIIYSKRNLTKEAMRAIGNALRISPDNPKSWNTYGFILDQRGRYVKAIEAFDIALKLSSTRLEKFAAERIDALQNKAIALAHAGEYSASFTTLEGAYRLDPQNLKVLRSLAWAAQDAGAFDRLIELTRILNDKDSSGSVSNFIRIVLAKRETDSLPIEPSIASELQDILSKREEISKAQFLQNDSRLGDTDQFRSEIRARISTLISQQMCEDAVRILTQAIREDSTLFNDLRQLGIERNNSGDYHTSLLVAHELHRLKPKSPSYAYAIATANRKLNRLDEAKYWYQKIIDDYPNGPHYFRARSKLLSMNSE